MTSDSDTYITLQQVYRDKACEHVADMQERIISVKKSLQAVRAMVTMTGTIIAD